MSNLYRNHVGYGTGLSPQVWNGFPIELLQNNHGAGFFKKWTGADVLHNGSVLELAGWKQTLQSDGGGGTSTASVLAAHGGGYVMTTDNAQDDGVNSQLVGQAIDLDETTDARMEAIIKVDAITQYQLALGLATTDTTVVASGALACTEFSGFLSLVTTGDADVTLTNQTGGSGAVNTALSSTAATLTAATYVRLGLRWSGGIVRSYVNGVADATYASTEYPTGVVVPTFWFGANTTTARVFTMPWIAFGYID